MTIEMKNVPNQTQAKNILSTRKSIFEEKVKKFLERDEFGFFKAKSKKVLEENTIRSEDKIQRLLDLKSKSEQMYRNLTIKSKDLKLKNEKLKEELMLKLKGVKNESNRN